jgi:hypothetical protein
MLLSAKPQAKSEVEMLSASLFVIFAKGYKQKREHSATNRFVLSFVRYKGYGLAIMHLTAQMRCSHLVVIFKASAKNIPMICAFLF